MQANIDAVRIGFPAFVSQLVSKKIDAAYNIVLFGLAPESILDAEPSGDVTRDVLKQVISGAGNNFTRAPFTLVHDNVSDLVCDQKVEQRNTK